MSQFGQSGNSTNKQSAYSKDRTASTGHVQSAFTREDIVDGLTALILTLREDGHTARVQIVGGAAIALTVDARRTSTADIDGPMAPAETVREVAKKIAAERGWRDDWINNDAEQFLPNGFGERGPEWVTIHQDDHVIIEAATPEMLLAMKLHAAQTRHNRDIGDVYVLMRATGIRTAEEAEELYEQFYPGDQFTQRLMSAVEHIAAKLDDAPLLRPPRPRFIP